MAMYSIMSPVPWPKPLPAAFGGKCQAAAETGELRRWGGKGSGTQVIHLNPEHLPELPPPLHHVVVAPFAQGKKPGGGSGGGRKGAGSGSSERSV